MTVKYKIPAKHLQTGEITHYKGNGSKPFENTVYGPKIFTVQKILDVGMQAAVGGYQNTITKG